MAKLTWNEPGSRLFEAGVDRGVLYPSYMNSGVPWNGLTNVSHDYSGGETRSYYIDGTKIYHDAANEDLELTIEAFTYPEEFEKCDGTWLGENGMGFDLQTRSEFGLTYRTRVGNDRSDINHGYKLHFIYNALASPTQKSYETINEGVDPLSFSWRISTRPVLGTTAPIGYRPTAHLFIDSTKTAPSILSSVEDILYGTPTTEPRLPSPTELMSEFAKGLFMVNENVTTGLSTLTIQTPADIEGDIQAGVYKATSVTRLKETGVTGVYDLE